MSWFDASNFANLAKNALKEAQKTFDKALEITDDDEEAPPDECSQDTPVTKEPISAIDTVIQSEPKTSNNTLWESFAIPFFEKPKSLGGDSEPSTSSAEDTKETRSDKLTCQPNTSTEQTEYAPLILIKRSSQESSDTNRLSHLSNENNRKSTVSSDSVEVLGTTSTITPDSEVSSSKVRSSPFESSSTEILTSSSIEVLDGAEEYKRLRTDDSSSESVEIIPNIDEDTDDNRSIEGGADDTSVSESTLTVLETSRLLRSSSSLDTSITEVLSPLGSGFGKTVNDMQETTVEDSLIEFTTDCTLPEPKLPFKRTRNELSGTSVNTLDSSSCDEGTMIGSSSDEAPKECTSSVSSLKSMLADAINEQPDDWTNRESSPTTSSMESRQEHVKIGSSGHTSADELETATSSDIEIISSPNGDSSNANSRQSPAKLIYRNSKGKMSVVLSSDVLIPEIIGRSLTFKMKGHNREPSEASSGGSDDSLEVDKLLKKIAELNEIIDVRESKLMDLSMRNAELSESNSNLKSQLECQMTEEFTQRLAALEKKFQQAIREKEMLRKQLESAKNVDASEFDEDKDEIIKALREEGEKLSKQQLQSNVLIKKLRATEKDHLKLIASLREQYDGLMQEVERAKKSLNAKEELERSQIEAINQLTKDNQKFKKETQTLQSQVNNLTSTLVSFQKEVEEKNEKICDLERRLQEVSSLAGQEVLQKAESELVDERRRREKLEFSLSSLQMSLQNSEVQHSERETALRKENQKLLNTLEEYKRKNEQLSEEMLNSTKPIVKQLENEINKSNAAATLWEKQEKDYLATINDLQDRLKLLSDNEQKTKERLLSVEDELRETKLKMKSLQDDVENKESQLQFQLKLHDLLREHKEISMAEKNEEIKKLQTQLEEMQKHKNEERPRNINEMYKDRSKLKLLLQGDAVSGNESDSDISMLSPTPSPQPSDGSNTWLAQLDDDPGPSSSQKGSIYDGSSRPITTATSAIENLQTQYKLKEGEVQQLQWELKKHDHERIILTNEITLLASKVEELEKRLDAQNELQTRYDALLQMYGEKMEECQELKLDLEDVKEMYKIQIDELLTRSRTG